MAEDIIIIGSDLDNPLFTFDAHAIRSINMVHGVDIVGTELTIDLLTPQVDYPFTSASGEVIAGLDFDGILSSDGFLICTNKEYGDLRLTPYGTPIRYIRDGLMMSKAYVKSVDRVGQKTYKVNAMSAIGLLDTQKHYGDIYRGAKFIDVLTEIIGDAVPFTVAEELENLQIYGWLPYDTKRANLHQLLFATGVMVARNFDGDMHFKFLTNQESTPIPDGHIYMGGSVDYSSPATAVDVTEHSFMELVTNETVTEYDNTDGSETADNTLLVFQNAPLHDLSTTGSLRIIDRGVNWAILSGTGILTGKKYTHSTRVMTRYAEGAKSQRENVITVADATLVNVANSENVAARVLAYYSSRKTVSTAFVVDGEQAGDLVTGTDPYQERISGFLSSMDMVVSSIIKANAKIVTDYIPSNGGNNYTQYRLLTGQGSIRWDELLEGKGDDDPVQITLLSGGHGGYSGEDGKSGTSPVAGFSNYTEGTPGEGGEGGAPGEGGKVLTITVKVSELRGLISAYECGTGGESDSEGGETTILGRSSSEGETAPYGVANLFTGEVFGRFGTEAGQKGGKGSGMNDPGENVVRDGVTWTPGSAGSSSTKEDNYTGPTGVYISNIYFGRGGSGGGPAVGSNGENGVNGSDGYPGIGGNGATPTARAAATGYGEGGSGGHGGGGAGCGGLGSISYSDSKGGSETSYTSAENGSGGKGGAGGKGGPGLIIIYI